MLYIMHLQKAFQSILSLAAPSNASVQCSSLQRFKQVPTQIDRSMCESHAYCSWILDELGSAVLNSNKHKTGFYYKTGFLYKTKTYCCIKGDIYHMCAIKTHGLYIFYPIFHCGLYCRAVIVTDSLCTKQGIYSIIGSKFCGLQVSAVSNQEWVMVEHIC